jgi:hypothetical protein
MAPDAPATEAVRHVDEWPVQILRRALARWAALRSAAERWSARAGTVLARWSVTLSCALGLLMVLMMLTAVGHWHARYGLGVLWIYPAIALPQAWMMAVMTYTLLRPELVAGGDGQASHNRQAAVARWLRWSTLAALLLQQIPVLYYDHLMHVLQLSGWLVLLVGLELAGGAPGNLRLTLARLSSRGILGPSPRVEELRGELERIGPGWTVASGCVVAVALLLTSPPALLAAGTSIGPAASSLALLIVAGAVAGSWLGRMTGYGRLLGRDLRRKELRLRLIPGHPDGAAGLKPVGDFYLYQSLTASLPAVFLGAWVLLISLGGASQLLAGYRPYLTQYLLLLPLAMLFEILVFVQPMSSVHAVMKNQKEEEFLPEVDRLSLAIASTTADIDDQVSADQEAARQQYLARLAEQYPQLENVPTWPVDSSIRRRFTLRNLGLLIPFLGYIVGHMPFWQQVSDALKG